VVACALPMVLWSLLVDRVTAIPRPGIDWDAPRRPWRALREISLTKIVGLWATWTGIAAFYFLGRWYWQGNYLFAMNLLAGVLPFLLALSVPYVLWLDRRLIEPRDGAYALGGCWRASRTTRRRWWGICAPGRSRRSSPRSCCRSCRPTGTSSSRATWTASSPPARPRLCADHADVPGRCGVRDGGYVLTMRRSTRISARPAPMRRLGAALICYPARSC
jgi:hypothetical protein